MRKFCSILTSIVFILLFTTCRPFTADIDSYLSYWAAETYITASTVKAVVQNDVSSIPSVPSAEDVSVTFKLNNPKSFTLDLPPKADAAKNVIVFEHLAQAPVIDTDYTLTQSEDRQSLILTYKASFLQAHEWGEQDLSSTLTLYATDGRKFKQVYTFKVKANTPPSTPGFTVAKTIGTPAYYVLCITVPDTEKTVPGGLLHKDITRIEVNGTPYLFSVNESENRFEKPESDLFIAYSDVEKLPEADADAVPSGGWVLYYKTDVEVKDGAAKKDYTVRLADAKGLVSGILNASTKPNKAEAERVDITKGTISGSGSGNSEGDPVIIACDSTGAELKVSSATAGVTVHGTLTDTATAAATHYNGNPITVPLPLNGAGEKTYKLEYYTDGDGFARTDVKTVYYRVVEGHTVTFDANTGAYPDGSTTARKNVLYGSTVTAPDPIPVKEGFYLPGWYKDQACSDGREWNFAADTVTNDTTLYAKWAPGEGTAYRVEHYQQNIADDNYPTSPTESENKTGKTGENAVVTLQPYSGFETGTYTPAKIAANGSTVVKVLYKRKTIKLTFNPNGGKIDDNTDNKEVSGKYGAALTPPSRPTWDGHNFSGWNPSVPGTFPSEEKTYTAQWDVILYNVIFSVAGGNGTISATPEGGSAISESPASVAHGKKITFTATPATGYEVAGWSSNVTGISTDSSTGISTATLSNITAATNKNVTVTFKKKVYTVTFSVAGGEGTLKGEYSGGNNTAQNGHGEVTLTNVQHGSLVSFTTSPTTGWEVEKWTLDDSPVNGTSPNYTISGIDGDKNVKVTFKRKEYTVTYRVEVVDGKAGGTIKAGSSGSPTTDSTVSVKHGDSVTFTAQPSTDWKIVGWTVSSGSFASGGGTSTTATLSDVKEAKTVTVKFYQSNIKSPAGWKDLARAVKSAPDNATITIDGEIKATDVDADKSEIDIDQELTIEGKNNAVLNADGKQGIFDVHKTLTLKDITLKNSKKSDSSGGGVYVNTYGKFIMKGSSVITECSAESSGGGVYVTGGTFEMHDSSAITDCTAKNSGGGVYVNGGAFKMSGSSTVTPKEDTSGKHENDVYLKTGKTITVDGSLSNNPAARITPQSYTENTPVLTGNITGGSAENRKKFIVPPQDVTVGSENGKMFWYITDAGKLKVEVEDIQTLKAAVTAAPADNTPFVIKLAGTISNLETVQIPNKKKIMLKADNASNPAILSPNNGQAKYTYFDVQSGASLTLEGRITLQGVDYGYQKLHYALFVNYEGTAEIKDGVTITGFKNSIVTDTHRGTGPVFVGGTLTMSGGTIEKNTVENNYSSSYGGGGGVYVGDTGNFIMTGGTITENKTSGSNSDDGGGGVYVFGGQYGKGQFTMEGGTIEKNEGYEGGGVLVEGIFTMKGGTITKNKATHDGKAVMLNYDFYWQGGQIKDNQGSGSVIGGNIGTYLHNTSGNTES